MQKEILIILSAIIASLISFVGILFLLIKKNTLNKILLLLVALSAGSLLGGVFFHLIPELIESGNFTLQTSFLILLGIILFFIIENFIHWRHCHNQECKEHANHLKTMNLVGDSVHNFIDGLIIAASYFISIPVGIIATLAVILHEIPQEIGDFGVLMYAGFSKKKAILLNFIFALTAILGALIGILIAGNSEKFIAIVIPIAIGGFLYIAGSDLIPEIHKKQEKNFSIKNLIAIILGMVLMYLLTFLEI